jgi:hypothetical protein
VRDPSKDKPFELEMSWLCAESGWKYSMVPAELLAAADADGRQVVATGGASIALPPAPPADEAAASFQEEKEEPVRDMDTS